MSYISEYESMFAGLNVIVNWSIVLHDADSYRKGFLSTNFTTLYDMIRSSVLGLNRLRAQ